MAEQPRVPAGSEEGGQWASKNGGTTATTEVFAKLTKHRKENWDSQIEPWRNGGATDDNPKTPNDPAARDFYNKFPNQAAYDAEMQRVAKTIADHSDPAMRVPLSALLGGIDKDGEFKSTFDTGKSGSGYKPESWPKDSPAKGRMNQYHKLREEGEQKLFDLSAETPSSNRPKYGVLIEKGNHEGHLKKTGDWLDQYGDATVVFKDSVRTRTTFIENDSLDSQGFRLPSHLDKPSTLSIYPGVSLGDHIRRLQDTKPYAGMFYHEAQYHGRLGVEDIHHVYLNKNPSEAQRRKLESMSKKRGFTWSVIQ